MVEVKHTPGPWVVGKAVNGCWIEAGGKSLARTFYHGVGWEQEEANAHLIAAAPELYEALNWFVSDIDGNVTSMPDFAEAVQRARAALAKAEGRS